MAQKTHPKLFRLGVSQNWDSSWYSEVNYSKYLFEDHQIRKFITNEFSRAFLSRILINRKSEFIEVTIHVARPGIIFGKSGIDLKFSTEQLKKKLNRNISIKVVEDKFPDKSAKLLSDFVANQIERRVPFRRAMKSAIQRAMKSGAYGVKVLCSGRLGGVEIARSELYKEGSIPLHTMRAVIDYSLSLASTTYGIIGVKVWLNKGELSSFSIDEVNNKFLEE
jgi:small subunit ribosomal protein S3